MKYAIGILNWIKNNKGLAILLIILLTGCGVLFYSVKTKSKCEDCRPYQKIAQDLITALSDKAVAYEVNESPYMTAVYYQDTTKPMTIKQYNKYKDSVLKHYQKKLDSLKTKQ
jgi:hypothetical protein